ncbi:hypothetical protein [Frederiksenia canicola]
MMRNPYQLTGYTANGKKTLLGTFEKHGQTVADMLERKADPQSVYAEFSIRKVYQWQINAYDENRKLDRVAVYQTKTQAEQALNALRENYPNAEMVFVGGDW